MSTNVETADVLLLDLSPLSLRELLLDGDTPLDRAAEAVVAGLADEVYAGFGNAPRAR